MTSWFIAIFFSTAGLMPSTTNFFPSVPESVNSIETNHNAYSVIPSTHLLAGYLDTMASSGNFVCAQRIFNVTEKTLTKRNGVVTNVSSKFLAKPQWLDICTDVEFSSYSLLGQSLLPPYMMEEQFAISTSPLALANFAVQKSSETGLAFKVYGGPEFVAHDPYSITGYKFTTK